MTATAIKKITDEASEIKNGNGKVAPGQPVRLSDAASVGDNIRQGDLYLAVAESIPENYIRIENPIDSHRQLVPGNTQGAKHCLDLLDGVDLYHPEGFGKDYEGLDGPFLVLTKERIVTHPTHGDVTLLAGFTIGCRYQREWDEEQKQERRNAD